VVRRVTRIEPAPGTALYVLALYDRSEQMRIEAAAAASTAELAATLESVADGVLVVDLAGHISHFNRRFSALWELPEEMLLLRADDEVFDWMRQRVESPGAYMRRLAEIEAEPMLRATDVLHLRTGAVLERVTLPQLSRGRPIGRVFSYRVVADRPS
jgi:PAS domain-containing protein